MPSERDPFQPIPSDCSISQHIMAYPDLSEPIAADCNPSVSCVTYRLRVMRETMGGAMGKQNPRRRAGRDALVRRVRALGQPCWICGLPIDVTLPAGHPLAFELDELVPVSKGGSPVNFENCKGAHRACNQWRQARSVASVIAIRDEVRRRFGPWPSSFAFLEGARAVVRGSNGRIGKAPVRHPKRSSGAL